mmetsp:Transcript_2595/g.4252  ORF Transcript_2595/g.4252 Transcript_2595/m.4252 type:complete len:210 (+) Transcript_2595:1261-1890(+)
MQQSWLQASLLHGVSEEVLPGPVHRGVQGPVPKVHGNLQLQVRAEDGQEVQQGAEARGLDARVRAADEAGVPEPRVGEPGLRAKLCRFDLGGRAVRAEGGGNREGARGVHAGAGELAGQRVQSLVQQVQHHRHQCPENVRRVRLRLVPSVLHRDEGRDGQAREGLGTWGTSEAGPLLPLQNGRGRGILLRKEARAQETELPLEGMHRIY